MRTGVDFVRGQLGSGAFTYGVAVAVILATAGALFLTRHRLSLGSSVWLLGLAGLVLYLTFGLADGSAEEAIHYVQYGTLSVLLFRAFSHRIRDYSIYVAATLAGTFVGMVDESVQWLTPKRYFDLRDIWLNFTAVALLQIGIAAGIRPRMIAGSPGWESLRRLCFLGALTIGYLGLCHLNTPERVAWYASNVPGLGFIDPDRSIMVEYGHLHGDDTTGYFRSRLTAEELRRSARDRAEDGARILDRYRDREDYWTFLTRYSPLADPFLHEARVHLFRRDFHLARAMESEDADAQGTHFATAYWENRILQDYFGELLDASSYRWSEELEADVREKADRAQAYDSWVSQHLIVAFTPRQLAFAFSGTVAALVLMGAYAGRRASRRKSARNPPNGDTWR
ncbi:VanZ family protein [Roseovarius sp. D22-M7]|uniref:VanZ family protein n=1 Tax=Roseovarius sp. D22-M7 TaxID=3127116 RepID=UPI00300FBA35